MKNFIALNSKNPASVESQVNEFNQLEELKNNNMSDIIERTERVDDSQSKIQSSYRQKDSNEYMMAPSMQEIMVQELQSKGTVRLS